MILGFAVSWWRSRESTWSRTPLSLLEAMQRSSAVDVREFPVQPGLAARAALSAWHSVAGGTWQFNRSVHDWTDRTLQSSLGREGVDAVLGLGRVEPRLEVPTFLYQDLSLSLVERYQPSLAFPIFPALPAKRQRDLVDRQRERYRLAAGIFTMSQWLADWIVTEDGIEREKVHVVGGGVNSAALEPSSPPDDGTVRLLFVGREFERKAGPDVVGAVEELNRRVGHQRFELTVVGGSEGGAECGRRHEWVRYLGDVPPVQMPAIWQSHHVFVMPSHFEAYGLVFREATASGMPSVGRAVCAMPELIERGESGLLVRPEAGADELADAVEEIVQQPAYWQRASSLAAKVDGWDEVADRMLSVIRATLRESR